VLNTLIQGSFIEHDGKRHMVRYGNKAGDVLVMLMGKTRTHIQRNPDKYRDSEIGIEHTWLPGDTLVKTL